MRLFQSYDELIDRQKGRLEQTEMRIIGFAIGGSTLLVATLTAASSISFTAAAPVWGAITAGCALMFVTECFRIRHQRIDLNRYESDRRNGLPANRADLVCERSVAAALAEGSDTPAIAEAA